MLMSQDFVLQRLREYILRLSYNEERVTEPEDDNRVDARESVRQLARTRVSDMLRQLRTVHGFSYEYVQDETGLPQQVLYDMEYRDRRLTLDELGRLAQLYQVSVADILGIEID